MANICITNLKNDIQVNQACNCNIDVDYTSKYENLSLI